MKGPMKTLLCALRSNACVIYRVLIINIKKKKKEKFPRTLCHSQSERGALRYLWKTTHSRAAAIERTHIPYNALQERVQGYWWIKFEFEIAPVFYTTLPHLTSPPFVNHTHLREPCCKISALYIIRFLRYLCHLTKYRRRSQMNFTIEIFISIAHNIYRSRLLC